MRASNKLTTRMSDRSDRIPFRGAGLSDHTITALLACGINVPKRLLSMMPAEIAIIPGIGKVSLSEIMQYRARQTKGPSMAVEERQPSCFSMEEEKGEGWNGGGTTASIIIERYR